MAVAVDVVSHIPTRRRVAKRGASRGPLLPTDELEELVSTLAEPPPSKTASGERQYRDADFELLDSLAHSVYGD